MTRYLSGRNAIGTAFLSALLVVLLCVAPAAAQDCPTKHPALTALDHAAMVAAVQASYRGLYGRNPTGQPGSGVDDTSYWVAVSDHYGEFSDHVCRAGWSAYWELKLGGADSVSPTLGDQPARFLPGGVTAPAPEVPPIVTLPPPIVTPPLAPALTVDYSTLIQQILASQTQLLDAQRELLTVTKDTNTHVVAIDHTVAETVGHITLFVSKYILPVVTAWYVGKKL